VESRDRVHREHASIAAAIRTGDSTGAELAALEHLRATGERLATSISADRQRLRAGGIALS
jgi:DNA-binding FadR family transcriptional regulator